MQIKEDCIRDILCYLIENIDYYWDIDHKLSVKTVSLLKLYNDEKISDKYEKKGYHKFYESIQSEHIWDKTKSVISKVGVHTLDFIEGVARDVAVESAKQAVTISMMQK